MLDSAGLIDLETRLGAANYRPLDVVLTEGKGAWVTDLEGRRYLDCLAAYSAAKFGVTGFSDAIRPELARDGVTLTTVFPLLIDTPLLDRPELPPILRQGRRIPASAVVHKVLRAVARRRATAARPQLMVLPYTV